MCGIAGKVGEFDPFQIMGLIHSNRVRGIEGFGAAWPKKNKWAFAKRAGDFADHMADRTFQSAFSQHCLLAHTRAASGGLGPTLPACSHKSGKRRTGARKSRHCQ